MSIPRKRRRSSRPRAQVRRRAREAGRQSKRRRRPRSPPRLRGRREDEVGGSEGARWARRDVPVRGSQERGGALDAALAARRVGSTHQKDPRRRRETPEDGLKKKTSQLEIRAEVREIINTAREEASGALSPGARAPFDGFRRVGIRRPHRAGRNRRVRTIAVGRRVRAAGRRGALGGPERGAEEELGNRRSRRSTSSSPTTRRGPRCRRFARGSILCFRGFTSETAVAALDLAAAGVLDAPADAPPAPKPRKTIPNNGPREAGIEEILFQGDTALAAGTTRPRRPPTSTPRRKPRFRR